MSLPICALAGSPLMFFYTLSVLLAPLMLAQYIGSFHPRDALHGSPLMFLYTLSVLLAPLVLAQYIESFHPRDALHRLCESAAWAP